MRPVLIASVIAILALAAGAFVFVRGAVRPSRPAVPIVVDLEGVKLTVLSSYLRPSSEGGGRLDRIDAAMIYPDFSAAESIDVGRGGDLDGRFERLLFVTLRKAGSDLAPAERLSRLYMRFLDDAGAAQPGGLVARTFRADSPFAGDDLYFDAPDGRAFAARCPHEGAPSRFGGACVADFRLDDVDAELRFPGPLLADWRNLRAGLVGFVEGARR